MTRLPPTSLAWWTGEIEQCVKPIDETRLAKLLKEAGAGDDRQPSIAEKVRELPLAILEYRLFYENGIDTGAAAEYTDKLLGVLRSLNELLADTAAKPVLGSAALQNLEANEIVREFRRMAPRFTVIVGSFRRRIPPATRGGNREPQRQYLAVRLIELFEQHDLDASAKPNSPMTRLYALLLDATGEGSDENAVGRPDAALKKALKLRGVAQQRPE